MFLYKNFSGRLLLMYLIIKPLSINYLCLPIILIYVFPLFLEHFSKIGFNNSCAVWHELGFALRFSFLFLLALH